MYVLRDNSLRYLLHKTLLDKERALITFGFVQSRLDCFVFLCKNNFLSVVSYYL